jgi:ROK family
MTYPRQGPSDPHSTPRSSLPARVRQRRCANEWNGIADAGFYVDATPATAILGRGEAVVRPAAFTLEIRKIAGTTMHHGSTKLSALRIDDYNVEVRDAEGHIGDRANKRAFKEMIDEWRGRLRAIGGDPLGALDTNELYKDKRGLERILLEGSPEAAGLMLGAIEDFAQELCGVLHRILDLDSWRDTRRVVIGGGFRERRVGELAIGRTAVLIKVAGKSVDLVPIRYHPDEAGLIGSIHLAPRRVIEGFDGILAVDIGGTNLRVGVVEPGPNPDLSQPRIWRCELWRHKDSEPSRDEAVDRLVSMLRKFTRIAEQSDFRLAPFIGIACPGRIRADGSIACGAQNLPGDWEDPQFNIARRIEDALAGSTIVVHNDAVVQGLSELPFMRNVPTWGVITIGTGLGNARFTND